MNKQKLLFVYLTFIGILTIIILAILFFLRVENNELLPSNNSNLNIPSAYLEDSLYCEGDNDCTLQETSCGLCDCPDPINNYNVVVLDCSSYSSENVCDIVCPNIIPKCINNKCYLES